MHVDNNQDCIYQVFVVVIFFVRSTEFVFLLFLKYSVVYRVIKTECIFH